MRKDNVQQHEYLSFVVVYRTPVRKMVGERRVRVAIDPETFYRRPEKAIAKAQVTAMAIVAKTGRNPIAAFSV